MLNYSKNFRTIVTLSIFLMLASINFAYSQTPEEKLVSLGITLPTIAAPVGSYVHAIRVGNIIYLSGKGPRKDDGAYVTGKVGSTLTIEEGQQAAKLAAVIQLAVLKQELGSLSNIKRIVRVNGFVNCDAGFQDQPKVINGFSDLMIAVFGEKGRHARTALGTNALPFNMAVEVEMIVEVE